MYSLSYQLRSENDQVVPNFWKNKVKRRELAPHAKAKWIEVKPFKIVQDRSKTNIFVSYCEEEEKRKKNEASFFFNKAKKNEYNRSSTIEDLPLLQLTTRYAAVRWMYWWGLWENMSHYLGSGNQLTTRYAAVRWMYWLGLWENMSHYLGSGNQLTTRYAAVRWMYWWGLWENMSHYLGSGNQLTTRYAAVR
jgi:hypothetical protein